MSFFDEVDEPRTPPRTQPRRRRPSGTGRRPPSDQQSIQTRRAVAAVALLIVVILVALGVHSCQVSARNSALKDYTNSVSSLITQSDETGVQLFQDLSSGVTSTDATSVQEQINQTHQKALGEYNQGRNLSVPDEVKAANVKLLLVLRMRVDGISDIAQQIQPALGTSASKDAINAIAAAMEVLYASDVLYKNYTAPPIVAALHAAGIAVGAPNGETISGGQFVPDVEWVTPTFIATALHVSLPGAKTGKVAPGVHGHALNSVSVDGTTLQTGSTNTIPHTPPPTFTLTFTNGGTNNETNVVCKVTVTGTNVSGQTVVPQTTAGQQATCKVPLTSSPPAGTETVVATIEKVPGEKNIQNNSLSFPVTFQ